MIRRLLILGWLIALSSTSFGGDSGTELDSLDPERTQISVLRSGRGEQVYAFGGHIFLRFRSDAADLVVNWGVFDFEEPLFLWRFLTGRLDYRVEVSPAQAVLESVKAEKRGLIESVLNFSAEQKRQLIKRTQWWLEEKNSKFRYSIWGANCAWLPSREICDIQGASYWKRHSDRVHGTYRERGRTYLSHLPSVEWLIDTFVGPEIDRPLTAADLLVMPLEVIPLLSNDAAGNAVLASPSRRLLPEAEIQPAFYSWHLTIPILFVGCCMVAALLNAQGVMNVLLAIWGVWSGGIAVAILFLWFFTGHEYCRNNANILLYWPVDLALALTVAASPGKLLFRRLTGWYAGAHLVAAVAAFFLGSSVLQQDLTRPAFSTAVCWVAVVFVCARMPREGHQKK